MDDTTKCAICLGSVEAGKGQAIFTAECSHSFHFNCITDSVTHGNHFCPVCRAEWKNLPFVLPDIKPKISSNATDRGPLSDSSNSSFQFPQPQPPTRHRPVFEPQPLQFSDDEPLPTNPISSSSVSGLQKVTIKTIPERPALIASESASDFTVLVGLTAPPLSEDAFQAQRAPIDLVTVLDISGSMRGSKLALVKRAVHFVIDNLGASDRLSVVSFSHQARRISPLRRMTENGRVYAKRVVDSLTANGTTNIVEGLGKGVRVLEERRYINPVASMMFLSDGMDTCNPGARSRTFSSPRQPPEYLNLLPPAVRPGNRETEGPCQQHIFPVHAFGFGSDHDPLAMHSISDASGGTFSFIESYEIVQDAFAICIGGLLSVVTQELRLSMRSASNGVEIKSIPSGRYAREISDQGSQGTIIVGDLYAEEEKEFLINLYVPIVANPEEGKTTLLDITCSYRDAVSNEVVQIETDLVEIQRPQSLSPQDMIVNLEVDRQRNRLSAAESIAEAQRVAETGNLTVARDILSKRRSSLLASASGQAGDGLSLWLEAEMKETEKRMGCRKIYNRAGRAYALSNMSSHGHQRAVTWGHRVAGAAKSQNCSSTAGLGPSAAVARASFGGYVTPHMAHMVNKSQQLNKTEDNVPPKQE